MERRTFLSHGLGAATLLASSFRRANAAPLSAQQRIRFGYAAITWGGEDETAIDEIAETGFRGVQLRASAVARYGDRPAALRAVLEARRLTFVALSSGLVRLDPAFEQQDLEQHLRNARFLRDAGGLYLQVVDERPSGRAITADDFRRMGRLLTNLGRRTADLGVTLGYHNHMGNLGQAPGEVAQVLEVADPEFVKLELDTAHYRQAGGDPAEAVVRHADRLLFLHVKDVERPVPGGPPDSYRFVEMGRGSVDFPALFHALRRIDFNGWAVVELDSVPESGRTPKQSAQVARRYIEETLGLDVTR